MTKLLATIFAITITFSVWTTSKAWALDGDDVARPLMKTELDKLARFKSPSKMSSSELQRTFDRYGHLDPDREVPSDLLKKAVLYYDQNIVEIDNKAYLTVIDFSKHSSRARLFAINMRTGKVWKLHAAHGSGSDPGNSGYARRFSNQEGSKATSLGFYKTAETYEGKHGFSLRLDGLSSSNFQARSRAIVVHGASYVHEGNIQAGRSWGCPAVANSQRSRLINLIKEGSIMYAGRAN